MEHYLKLTEEGIIYGKKPQNSNDIKYDETISFDTLDDGIEWVINKFGIEKREIQYIHQLDI